VLVPNVTESNVTAIATGSPSNRSMDPSPSSSSSSPPPRKNAAPAFSAPASALLLAAAALLGALL
jgi:hypothetical protein